MTEEQQDIVNIIATNLVMTPKHERAELLARYGAHYISCFHEEWPDRTAADCAANLNVLGELVVRRLRQIETSSGGTIGTA